VESIIPGGAADKVGTLQPKDKIIAVAQEDGDWVDVIDMSLRDVVSLIRGKRDSKVHLRVLRQSETTQTLNVTIVRDKIDLEERSAKLRIEDVGEGDQKLKLAVIELPSFYGDRNPAKRQSSRDVRNLIAAAKKAGADGLLLDLSRNGGGLLETAVEITGYFIRDGGVVAVKGTDSGVQVLPDDDASILYDGPMAVLTSRVSASASEIVAGALKDYERALILGDDHTFGKGTVQSMVPLPPGLGALKVTTALFFRPGGASTQHDGVPSDVVIPSLIGSSDDFGEKSQEYSLPGQSIEPFLGLPAPDGDQDGESEDREARRSVKPETDPDFVQSSARDHHHWVPPATASAWASSSGSPAGAWVRSGLGASGSQPPPRERYSATRLLVTMPSLSAAMIGPLVRLTWRASSSRTSCCRALSKRGLTCWPGAPNAVRRWNWDPTPASAPRACMNSAGAPRPRRLSIRWCRRWNGVV